MNTDRVLVTDFDGTMTDRDFYSLVVENLLPTGTPEYWKDFRAGRITHFEALQSYFAAIQSDEATVLRMLNQMELDPNLGRAVSRLEKLGWKIVVASAGCQWYIDKLLAAAGISLEVHANPGHFVKGQGLVMNLPTASPFYSRIHGIDKVGIVQHFLEAGATVAFAGDGFPDIDAAKAVESQLRFARRDLSDVLTLEGHLFQSFSVWSQIADKLIELYEDE